MIFPVGCGKKKIKEKKKERKRKTDSSQYYGTYVPIKNISKVCVKQSDAVMTEWPPHHVLYPLDKSHMQNHTTSRYCNTKIPLVT